MFAFLLHNLYRLLRKRAHSDAPRNGGFLGRARSPWDLHWYSIEYRYNGSGSRVIPVSYARLSLPSARGERLVLGARCHGPGITLGSGFLRAKALLVSGFLRGLVALLPLVVGVDESSVAFPKEERA